MKMTELFNAQLEREATRCRSALERVRSPVTIIVEFVSKHG